MSARENLTIESLSPGDRSDEWDRFVDESPQGNIFCRSWWLEAVCPNGFEIVVLRRNGKIVAGMPLARYRKYGYETIEMPRLTQTLGVLHAAPTSQKYERRLSAEMGLTRRLVDAIPQVSFFNVNFHHTFTNWLPFCWAGYKQTTRYTYVIEDLTHIDKVVSEFAHSKRKNIRRAEKLIEVHEDLAPDDFYTNHRITLQMQGETISYSRELFGRIYEASYNNGSGKTWYALDSSGNMHAAIFVVFDPSSAYYLISSIDPNFRNSGASSLLVKRAIEFCSERTRCFDFEGSMIQGVEESFRRFGAHQKPYFTITKDSRNILKSLKFFRAGAGSFARALGIRK